MSEESSDAPVKMAEQKIQEFIDDMNTMIWPRLDVRSFAIRQVARMMVRKGWERV